VQRVKRNDATARFRLKSRLRRRSMLRLSMLMREDFERWGKLARDIGFKPR
jgi:hypothetical protein